jgi:hypothetical protein
VTANKSKPYVAEKVPPAATGKVREVQVAPVDEVAASVLLLTVARNVPAP